MMTRARAPVCCLECVMLMDVHSRNLLFVRACDWYKPLANPSMYLCFRHWTCMSIPMF